MRRINAEFTCRTNCSSSRLFLDSFQTGGLDRPGFLGGRDLWEGWGSWYPEGYLKLNSKKYRLITALNESEKVRSGRARIELTCACTRAPGHRVPGPPASSPALRTLNLESPYLRRRRRPRPGSLSRHLPASPCRGRIRGPFPARRSCCRIHR